MRAKLLRLLGFLTILFVVAVFLLNNVERGPDRRREPGR